MYFEHFTTYEYGKKQVKYMYKVRKSSCKLTL